MKSNTYLHTTKTEVVVTVALPITQRLVQVKAYHLSKRITYFFFMGTFSFFFFISLFLVIASVLFGLFFLLSFEA